MAQFRQHSSHWGAFRARTTAPGVLEIEPFDGDPEPSALLRNIPAALAHPARLSRPLVRKGWLEDGPGPDRRRGSDEYIELDWDHALDLAARELRRLGAGTLPETGPLPGAKVFGGSYGWASAGRFHHAQSQLHRFLNTAFGGYVASVDTYSSAAGSVILSMVWGDAMRLNRDHPYLNELAEDTELLIAFGGVPLRNTAVSSGGNSQHSMRDALERAAARGAGFVSISPIADDIQTLPGLVHLAPRPGTDVALMLGMAHHLHSTGQADRAYLDRYTTGYDRFLAYLTGETDGVARTPDWAADICGIPAADIAALADRAARSRTLINVTYSLQRAQNGEQPVWMALTLATMLGEGGKPGGGFLYGLGSIGNVGKPPLDVPLPTLPQGPNRVGDFIPCARIAELLLNPGGAYTYKGEARRYADIRLVYWAGGNPFHHHQDLTRLAEAFARPDTIIVHDSVGTATTRHADIVFPATVTAEREDIGAGGNDPFLVAMEPLAQARGEARDDYATLTALAERIGCAAAFTEGLDAEGWLRRIYAPTQAALAARGLPAPDFDDFRQGAILPLPVNRTGGAIHRFHADPEAHPLRTPSGRIEIFSDRVAAAGLPGHPAWLPPAEWLGAPLAARHPFQLVANQPAGRLHSQLDFGVASRGSKLAGREVARLNPDDAARLGVAAGDAIRIWNGRGAVLAVAQPSEAIRAGVIQLATGAWYAPTDLPGLGRTCINGNPNAVTSDCGASPLSQGCAGQLALVSVERLDGDAPAAVPHEKILPRG
ncbi:molybdopterin-dependent oxidoreductase [Falsirhodobacter xinxiangensis]|uniref:molybdopterin-dependent oxidoreductase n=1 Tax=Falsirhodobacter xinxiangensis TaxID=2530049 RepID=UPI0010AA6429|nr:molybdopterin-dependent oxidoreductase [Rhodobacter xinxiangensis]